MTLFKTQILTSYQPSTNAERLSERLCLQLVCLNDIYEVFYPHKRDKFKLTLVEIQTMPQVITDLSRGC